MSVNTRFEPLDVKGTVYGMLTAVRPTEERKNGSVVWEWKCNCGNTVYKTLKAVKRSSCPNCGCLRGSASVNTAVVAGRKYGMLTAVCPTDKRSNTSVVWEWKCDCGNTVYKTLRDVKQVKNPNCGCKPRFDITGDRYGALVAVRPTGERKYTSVVWEWKCDCGNTVCRTLTEVKQMANKDCGCGCSRDLQ